MRAWVGREVAFPLPLPLTFHLCKNSLFYIQKHAYILSLNPHFTLRPPLKSPLFLFFHQTPHKQQTHQKKIVFFLFLFLVSFDFLYKTQNREYKYCGLLTHGFYLRYVFLVCSFPLLFFASLPVSYYWISWTSQLRSISSFCYFMFVWFVDELMLTLCSVICEDLLNRSSKVQFLRLLLLLFCIYAGAYKYKYTYYHNKTNDLSII